MRWEFPHPLAIILGFIALAGLLTYILPAGSYDRKLDSQTGREIVLPGTYHSVSAQPIGLTKLAV